MVRRLLAAGALALPLLLLAPTAATAADTISRDTVMNRAARWGVGEGRVPYSWYTCYTLSGKYRSGTPCPLNSWRADCSGYVSMAWNTINWTTVGDGPVALTGVAGAERSLSKKIGYSSLRRGDALAYQKYSGAGAHIVLFVRWADSAKSRPVIWELAGGTSGPRQRTWSPSYVKTYTAWRFEGIR